MINLYTDASVRNDPDALISRWACVIKQGDRFIQLNGRCHLDITNSNAAEMYAVLRGLDAIINLKDYLYGYPQIKHYSDSTTVVDSITYGSRTNANLEIHFWQLVLQSYIEENKLEVKSRFISAKSHDSSEHVRLMQLTDRLSKAKDYRNG